MDTKKKEIHEGDPRRARRGKELSTKGKEEREGKGKKISTKGEKEKAKTCPRRATKNGEGPLRGWRRLERDPPRIAKGRKDFHEKGKRYPRRATKNGEGPRRGWRRLERDPPRVAKGRKISRKRQKDFHEGPRRTAKGHEGVGGGSRGIRQRSGRGSAKELQGVGKDSKGVREGRRRKTLRGKRFPRRTLGLSTKWTQIQEDQKIMFPSFGLSVEHESMPDSKIPDHIEPLAEATAMALFPVDPSGGDGRGCARLGAGGTPALPGSLHPMTSSHQGHQIAEAFWRRFVPLRGPSWITLFQGRVAAR